MADVACGVACRGGAVWGEACSEFVRGWSGLGVGGSRLGECFWEFGVAEAVGGELAECVDVGFFADRESGFCFGWGEAGCAGEKDASGCFVLKVNARGSEVDQHGAVGTEDDVVRGDVAVSDPKFVQLGHDLSEPSDEPESFVEGERTLRLDGFLEGWAVDEF